MEEERNSRADRRRCIRCHVSCQHVHRRSDVEFHPYSKLRVVVVLTCHGVGLQSGEPVAGEDEPDEPRHVGEGAGQDVVDQVVGQVHREQLGLRHERVGVEFLCNGDGRGKITDGWDYGLGEEEKDFRESSIVMAVGQLMH